MLLSKRKIVFISLAHKIFDCDTGATLFSFNSNLIFDIPIYQTTDL